MDLVGWIVRDPRITLEEWLTCARKSTLFVRPATRTAPNPFKPGEWATIVPGEGDFSVVLDGEPTGAITPSDDFDEDGELDVWAWPVGGRTARPAGSP